MLTRDDGASSSVCRGLTGQAGSRPEPVEAQPLTVTPATQYVTRSAAQPAASPAAVASH